MTRMVSSQPEASSRTLQRRRGASGLDVLIVGGGIAGLWTLDELRRRGLSCALVEKTALGAGQTIWSQGIIHGGLKYTLAGLMNPSAEAIREMPAVWRACLAGEREPDLSAAGVRAPYCHLWQTGSIASRVGMIGARVGLRVSPVVLESGERPAVLRECPGVVARLDEQVIDPAAVLRVLAERNAGRVFRGTVCSIREEGEVVSVVVRGGTDSSEQESVARWVVFAAGNGNEALRDLAGLPAGRTQVRPLRMAMVRGPGLPELNGHCVDGAKTRATITTARDAEGRNVWQVGGEVAERGVGMGDEEFMRFARAELRAVLPGVEFGGCEWSFYDAPRAEAAAGGARPEDASVIREGRILTVFPTKMALAPRAASVVADAIGSARGGASGEAGRFAIPRVAAPPWDEEREWQGAERCGGK